MDEETVALEQLAVDLLREIGADHPEIEEESQLHVWLDTNFPSSNPFCVLLRL